MSVSSGPIAVVIPWFGRELRGGAERQAWELAARLAAKGHEIEVITTCCRAHQDDWATNHLPAGLATEPEGFTIRRFPVVERNRPAFDRVNGKLTTLSRRDLKRGVSPLSPDEETVFADELMRSPELLEHLAVHGANYTALIFLPYLYFTTLRGLPLVAERSILVPCLHHEAYAFLPLVATAFQQAAKILFNSEGERRLAISLYGPGIVPRSSVGGEGVDFPTHPPAPGQLDVNGLRPYVLCLGRQDSGKNTDFLARAYAAYRARHPEPQLRLVLAGPGKVELPSDRTGIVDLGAVGESDKWHLLGACEALFNPSINESYSRVIMEAWHLRRPVGAHRDCLPTATAVTLGGGGWVAGTLEEWAAAFHNVATTPEERLAELGTKGRAYADELADWDQAIARYEHAFRQMRSTGKKPPETRLKTVHQVLPNLTMGDAISNEAIWIRNYLRRTGHESDIFAIHIDPRVASEARRWVPGIIDPDRGIIYHHSIGSEVTAEISRHAGPKAMIYHNITPERFLTEYLPLNADLCREARADLRKLARHFPVSVGDSTYNAIELSEFGFPEPSVLPLCVDPGKWNMSPDPDLMHRLQDGRTNILFVGRLSPNKRQEDLIVAFAHYRNLDPSARLHLIGGAASSTDLYQNCLHRLTEELGLTDCVNFSGSITDRELMAYYQSAHLFWSMSEHEGFCVPLIEAMWFDIPVMAFAACAVPETMADAGRQFSSKSDPEALAQTAFELVNNPVVREQTIERQRVRREAFLAGRVEADLEKLLERMAAADRSHETKPAAMPPIKKANEIAVVKLDHIGDVLLATPTFFSLKRRFPGASITAIVAPACTPVLRGNPHVDRVVAYDPPWFWRDLSDPAELRRKLDANQEAVIALARHRFDLIVNLRSDHANLLFSGSLPHRFLLSYTNDTAYPFLITHPLTRTQGMHATQQHQELLRTIGADEWTDPAMYFSEGDLARASQIGDPRPNTVVLALGAGIPLKRWAPTKFKELARRLRAHRLPVAIVGTAADAAYSEPWAAEYGCSNLCGRFTLNELAAYFSTVGCLVANDSAPMHIGAAAGIPVVYIMRPLVREEFQPVGTEHVACVADRCTNSGSCVGFDPNNRNAAPNFCACIQNVTVDEVEEAVLGVLERRSRT